MLTRLLYSLYLFVSRRKLLSVAVAIPLFLLIFFFASRISFRENITQLIPSNEQADVTTKVLKQVSFADKITIVISAKENGTPDDLSNYADALTDSLKQQCAQFIDKLQGKFDERNIQQTLDFVYANLPLFLDQADYNAIRNKIDQDSIARIVENNFKSLLTPTGLVTRDFVLKDPLGISFLALRKLQQLTVGDDYRLNNGYVSTRDGRNVLLFITPKLASSETDSNAAFIEKLEGFRATLNSRFSDVAEMSYFGATPVAVGNATQIKADVRTTLILSILLLSAILVYFYRSLSTLLLIFLPSLLGAAFALAVLHFTRGTISAIALGISSILLGETSDYSVYILTHLRNKKDIKLLYKEITKPVLLCGITTAISFLCLIFIDSVALQDLGIFATLAVMSTAFFSLVLIPQFYKVQDRFHEQKVNAIDNLGNIAYHKKKFLVASVVAVTIVCFFTYSRVGFNNDLAELNYMSPELEQTQRKLEAITDGDTKSIYLVTHGNSLDTVLKENTRVFNVLKEERAAGGIVNFSSIGGLIFSEDQQKQKIADWNRFWSDERKQRVSELLVAEGEKFGLRETAYSGFYSSLGKEIQTIQLEEYRNVGSFFLDEFVSVRNGFYTVASLVKIPEANRDEFIQRIKNIPEIVVIDRKQTNESLLGSLKDKFGTLVAYSFIATFLVVLISFRRFELVLVSIFPVAISWVVTTGIMGIAGLQFNIVNIVVCTLIFGLGVDYSIVLLQALQKEFTYSAKELPTYRTSIFLSMATTVLSIGVLGIAEHPALKSISLIAVIGIFSALFVSFVLQPLVFELLAVRRVENGKAPLRFRPVLNTVLSFTYYGLGSIVMSLFSLTLMKIIPLSKKAKLNGFRYVMSRFMASVLYTNPFVSKRIINERKETFARPAIVIANHTSFLDILVMGMLNRKFIFLVKDWVYNSPVFGPVVRKAGFYSVSRGLENGLDHFREKINEGYSLVVFPEGTRSQSNQIRRFHKGAFYLAEQLKLDILPVIIHGTSEVLPKGDFIVNDGKITVKILDRISPQDLSFGGNYTERTRRISSYFKQEFAIARKQFEGPDYFRKTVIDSFEYKESQVIKAVKKDLVAMEEVYYKLNEFIPRKAKVVHLAEDYGQIDILLALQEPQRRIVSFISDAEKRAVAKNNYIVKNRAIRYVDNLGEVSEDSNDLLLISGSSITDSSLLNKGFGCVILLNTMHLKQEIIDLGFEVECEEQRFMVLKRVAV